MNPCRRDDPEGGRLRKNPAKEPGISILTWPDKLERETAAAKAARAATDIHNQSSHPRSSTSSKLLAKGVAPQPQEKRWFAKQPSSMRK